MPLGVRCRKCGAFQPLPICARCARAAEDERQRADGRRRNATSFYRTKAWRRLARQCIRRDRDCAVCGSEHRLTAAHIVARPSGVRGLTQYDVLDNLLTLCGPCHSRYEAAVKGRRETDHRTLIEQMGAALLRARGLTF